MKITFTATVDLGDDFCDASNQEEIDWAKMCVKKSRFIHLYDVDDDYPIKVTSINLIEDNYE